MKKWYEVLFENFGKKYDQESFTKGPEGEWDFIEKEVNYNKISTGQNWVLSAEMIN